MEKIIFYILTFCIGTLFGSFFTLAVYRIPLHQDITHKRSYCPNCNHKLSFWDMIPILSYLFLGGKCRYCKEKIRVRYICLEILTGIIFLLLAMSCNISFPILQVNKLIYLLFTIFYLSGMIIIAGIDQEKRTIQKSLILYETIIVAFYMVYLYIVEKANIYRYAIYLLLCSIFLLLENTYLKKKLKDSYPLEILELSMIMAIYSSEILYITTVIVTLLTITIKYFIKMIINRNRRIKNKEESYYQNLPIGYYLICSNIFLLIMINWMVRR